MKELFSRFYFYELNAGSLFSKWFSESSHNLTRFFHDITQICLDPMTFVIILIDDDIYIYICVCARATHKKVIVLIRSKR